MEMWTVQMPVVDETLKRDGVCYVKQEYIHRKYQETAWVFRTAYGFMICEMEKRVPKPDRAQSPIWVFYDRSRVFCHAGAILYHLEIPREEMVLFDLRDWQEILSLRPLGTAAERKSIHAEILRQGAGDPTEVFRSPFYPALKKRIRDSWKCLLQDDVCVTSELSAEIETVTAGRQAEESSAVWRQGAVWCLKKDWILGQWEL